MPECHVRQQARGELELLMRLPVVFVLRQPTTQRVAQVLIQQVAGREVIPAPVPAGQVSDLVLVEDLGVDKGLVRARPPVAVLRSPERRPTQQIQDKRRALPVGS